LGQEIVYRIMGMICICDRIHALVLLHC